MFRPFVCFFTPLFVSLCECVCVCVGELTLLFPLLTEQCMRCDGTLGKCMPLAGVCKSTVRAKRSRETYRLPRRRDSSPRIQANVAIDYWSHSKRMMMTTRRRTTTVAMQMAKTLHLLH